MRDQRLVQLDSCLAQCGTVAGQAGMAAIGRLWPTSMADAPVPKGQQVFGRRDTPGEVGGTDADEFVVADLPTPLSQGLGRAR